MRERTRKTNINGILALLLFAVFMVSVLFVLLTGADVYQELARRDQRSYDQRTAAQYITTRIRQADRAGMVSVRALGDRNALVFMEEYDGVPYETWVYCCDGYLRELFLEAGLEQDPEYGEPILPAQALHFFDRGTFIQVELELPEGARETLMLHLRNREGETS